MGDILLSVRMNVFMEGIHKQNVDDVMTRVQQHIVNYAFQRKREDLGINDFGNKVIIPLTEQEQEFLNKFKTLIVEIKELKDKTQILNTKCVETSKELAIILDKYINEIPNQEE